METGKAVNFVNGKPTRAPDNGYLPYMEIKSSCGQETEKVNAETHDRTQEDDDLGLSLQLGKEYELKKQKLKEELRLDFRRYVAERKAETKAPYVRQEGVMKAPSRTHFASTSSYHPSFPPKLQEKSPERPLSSKRDVGTVTEPLPWMNLRPAAQRHWDEPPEHRHARPRRHRQYYSSEEDLDSDDEQADLELLNKRRPRHHAELHSTRKGRRPQPRVDRFIQERRSVEVATVNEEDNQEQNRQTPLATHNHTKTNSSIQTKREASNKNIEDFATGLLIGVTEQDDAVRRRKECYRQDLLNQIDEQRRNKKREKDLELKVAVTGVNDPEKQPDRIKQFGGLRREHEHRRDVAYKPQMVQSTRGTELHPGEPPERPRVAFQSPILEYSAALGHLPNTAGISVNGATPVQEDFNNGLTGSLADMVAPRVSFVPPPVAPTLSEAYSTPYDDAYYYYGARNPLDSKLTFYGASVDTAPSLTNLPLEAHTSALHPPAEVLAQLPQLHDMAPSKRRLGAFSDQQQNPPKNNFSYKEALQQQIEERQERRRLEREERERYDAKLEAERKAYEPWGRGGAGAPLKDDRGNLISDLKRMHRSNEEASANPDSRNNRRVVTSVEVAAVASKAEDKEPSRMTGVISSSARPSPHARGNVFNELPTPQQIREQESYKESLKRQIEEKRKLEEEKKERLRLEEEQEEMRLAEERAHIQRQYEEEQEKEKRKEMEQNAKNQELIRLAEERRKEAEQKRNEEEIKESENLRQQYVQERQTRLEQDYRSHSPPIPAVQKRLGKQNSPRPPSVDSQRSAAVLSAASISTPDSPPVPARRNQLRAAEDQQGVLSELSVLRSRLKSEQKRLEGQLLQSDREDTQSPLRSRDRRLPDVFDMTRLRVQVSARRPPSNTRPVNKQNVQDFNQLKYRDGRSREEVRRAYPEPPTDDESLEIQQQALLQKQQHRLHNMQRPGAVDYFEPSSRMKPAAAHQHREYYADEAETHSLLQSESAFIDANGHSFSVTPQPEQLSARERRRRSRRPDYDDAVEDPAREIRQFLGSAGSSHLDGVREQNQRRIRALDHMEQSWRRGGRSADEEDRDLWQQTPSPAPSRRVSTTTVATEPWLRPGTTETMKKLMAGHRPPSQEWNLPSIYQV